MTALGEKKWPRQRDWDSCFDFAFRTLSKVSLPVPLFPLQWRNNSRSSPLESWETKIAIAEKIEKKDQEENSTIPLALFLDSVMNRNSSAIADREFWVLPFVFLNTLTKRSLWLFLCYAVPRNKNKTEVLGRILTKIITQEASTLRIYQSICP